MAASKYKIFRKNPKEADSPNWIQKSYQLNTFSCLQQALFLLPYFYFWSHGAKIMSVWSCSRSRSRGEWIEILVLAVSSRKFGFVLAISSNEFCSCLAIAGRKFCSVPVFLSHKNCSLLVVSTCIFFPFRPFHILNISIYSNFKQLSS